MHVKTSGLSAEEVTECAGVRVYELPGGGISRSVVCWTLVLPGRGSKAGTRAENCLFRTKSSSQVLLRPPLVSYSSSSCRMETGDALVHTRRRPPWKNNPEIAELYYQDLLVFLVLLIVIFVLVVVVVRLWEVFFIVQLCQQRVGATAVQEVWEEEI